MDLPLIGHLPLEVVARSPEPERLYYSNPDWALDDQGPLLLWDTFGGDFELHLARPDGEGWRVVAELPDTMHSHVIHLPEQDLWLVLGVNQRRRPRSIDLWHSPDGDHWSGPTELFGAADYHAGSTPWAIHQGRLFVPFEIQQTAQWGSFCFGAVHADLTSDLRRPGSWTLTQSRVPWSVLPGCSHCGGLEGNLVVAPDGELYNLLRLPAYNRLGRARWTGCAWEWLGLIQGVHNQSKHEVFAGRDGQWYLLANGWPARRWYRNALCLWQATTPDLASWRLLRVIDSDHDPRHAFSYVAALVDAADTLWIGERHGDDETFNMHDTNCCVVRRKAEFGAWVEEPALVPYGNDEVGDDGTWVKSDPQDGLLLSHLDGALYPLTLTATVRLDTLPTDVGVFDLLGFATCDLVSQTALQLVWLGQGPQLALSTGGRRVALREPVEAGAVVRLTLRLLSPVRCEAQLDDDTPVQARTHLATDPTLAGVLPRSEHPAAPFARVTVLERPVLTAGDTACPAPPLPGALIVADGRGVTGALEGNVPAPAENLVAGGPLVAGGHPAWFEPWAGGLLPGANTAALWSPLAEPPAAFTCGGFVRQLAHEAGWTVMLAALGERTPENGLRRDRPYLALLLQADQDGHAKPAVAWRTADDRQVVVGPEPSGTWLFYALTAVPSAAGLELTVWLGEPGGEASGAFTATAPTAAVSAAHHWLALMGAVGNEVRGSGGVFYCTEAWTAEQVQAVCAAGFAAKMDTWPAQQPSCAQAPPAA